MKIPPYSILHISDLHKGENNDFKNLFASLCNDVDSYEQNIPKPELIVVSGDLAEGANGEGAEEKIIKQYKEVEAFLNDLVDFFLEGDKRKIIIVPGNHDLFRGDTINSMHPIPEESRGFIRERYLKGDPNFRWNWMDFNFYEIHCANTYASRFRFFVDFYNRFYAGIRKIEDCDLLNDVVDLPEYNISFALFNSCYRIDHLNQIGAICTTAIANAQTELSRMFKYGRFIVGVWHHNISGIPSQTNYLDPRTLYCLTDFHIQVGLYGHQHHAEVIYEYRDIFRKGRMSLISSGCLYGRGKALPEGTHCQYNIIVIEQNLEEKKANLTIHVREDDSGWDIPSWRKKQIDGKDSFTMTFNLPTRDYNRILNDIVDRAKTTNDYVGAVGHLVNLRAENPIANKFIDDFLKKVSNEEILKLNCLPNTESQVISILGACMDAHDWQKFDIAVEYAKSKNITSPRIDIMIEDAQKLRWI